VTRGAPSAVVVSAKLDDREGTRRKREGQGEVLGQVFDPDAAFEFRLEHRLGVFPSRFNDEGRIAPSLCAAPLSASFPIILCMLLPGLIRPARDDDAARLAQIHVAAWRRGYRDILPAELLAGLSIARRTRDWTQWLASPASWTFGSEHEGRLVGFATIGSLRANGRPSRSLVEVRMLYVDPEHWRGGIGRGLHERVLDVARERGFTQIVLWVLSKNRRARAFYEALGFEPDRTRRVTIGGHPVDEIRYCLSEGAG
jgi:GNAT superfamily N-acetyltransferase